MDLPVTFAPALPTSPRSGSRSPFHSSARSQRHLRLVSAKQGCCRWKFVVSETPAHRPRKGEYQSLCGSTARPSFRSPGTPHGVPPQPIAGNYTCPMTSGLSLLCNSRKEFAVLPSRDGAFQDLRRDHRARQRCASTGAGSAASRKRIRARLRNSRPNGCNQAPDPDGRCAPYDDAA